MKIIEIKEADLLALHHHDNKTYPFLLESVTKGEKLGQFSFLFCFPQEQIRLNNLEDFDFFDKLSKTIKVKNGTANLPFLGGWFVYLSYELNKLIEPRLKNNIIDNQVIACITKIPTAIIIDHKKQKTYIVDEESNEQRIAKIIADIKIVKKLESKNIYGELFEEDEIKFLNGIDICKKHITQGDTFQINLSRLWNFELTNNIQASYIYQQLRLKNPADFAALVEYENFSIISSSPERLFQVKDNIIQTRPIAGTQATNSNDSLLDNKKELAEHIMLVDLERNDLGRLCKFNTIKVDELLTVEKHPFVNHLVSNIQGELKENINISDIIKALFPGGSITGCPKVRTMEIINELEQVNRGAYTGSIGYISNNGVMDFNILIRSLTKKKNNINFRTGAGIVLDSIAKDELAETRDKAQGLLKVFSIDEQLK